MTVRVAIDVVIGLVFIYLLYSLLATVIMEIITSFLGLRARNLRYALRRMLMDEKEFAGKWAKIKKNSLKIFNSVIKIVGKAGNLTNSKLFKNFFNQAIIKYLSSGGISNKPSYLNPQNFSKALIDTLKSGTNGKNSLAKIKAGIDNLPAGSQTKEYLESLLDDANNDLVKFKLMLEQWFEDTMERATGWFKRRIQYILLIIGFGLAVSFNADTLAIIKKLSKDPDARQQLVDMAISYSKENKVTIDYINLLRDKPPSVKATIRQDEKDSILLKKIDTLISIRKSLSNDIYEAQNIFSSNWRISDVLRINSLKDFEKKIQDSVNFKYRLVIQDTLIVKNGDFVLHIAGKDTLKYVKNEKNQLLGFCR